MHGRSYFKLLTTTTNTTNTTTTQPHQLLYHFLDKASHKKKMSQIVEKVHSAIIKIVYISKCRLFRMRGGSNFQMFPKFKQQKYGLDFYDIWDWYS